MSVRTLASLRKERAHYRSLDEKTLRQEWRTPDPLFDALDDEVGSFTLDVAADDWNHKCLRYYTADDDGLNKPWGPRDVVWCNPPFKTQGRWVERGFQAARDEGSLVWLLLHASTSPVWFRRYAARGEIRLFTHRINYQPPPGIQASSADFDSMLVIFNPQRLNADPSHLRVSLCDELGRVLHVCREWVA